MLSLAHSRYSSGVYLSGNYLGASFESYYGCECHSWWESAPLDEFANIRTITDVGEATNDVVPSDYVPGTSDSPTAIAPFTAQGPCCAPEMAASSLQTTQRAGGIKRRRTLEEEPAMAEGIPKREPKGKEVERSTPPEDDIIITDFGKPGKGRFAVYWGDEVFLRFKLKAGDGTVITDNTDPNKPLVSILLTRALQSNKCL